MYISDIMFTSLFLKSNLHYTQLQEQSPPPPTPLTRLLQRKILDVRLTYIIAYPF
jgi:hypothetical protein